MATVHAYHRQSVKFKASVPTDFYPEVKRRVDAYFAGKSKQGDYRLWGKTLFLLTLNAVIYFTILSNAFSFGGVILLYTLLGIVTSLICINVTHDTLHGAFFKSKKNNHLFGYLFDAYGFSSYIWNVSHNLEHHTYTNIAGLDHDIDKMIWLRLAPTDGYYSFHRFQHIYALPLYTMTSLNWAYYSDIIYFFKGFWQGSIPLKNFAIGMFFKIFQLSIFVLIPIALLSISWWQIVIAYIAMQMAGGLLAAILFQLAHVVEGVEYPLPDEYGKMEDLWAIHELKTTSNFATNTPWVGHLFGGLNFQLEHHLFPQVSHVHYPAISKIMKTTAAEYGLPYHEHPSFSAAVLSHLRTLKKLGRI